MEINLLTVLNIIKKGKKYFLYVFLLTFVISTAIAFLLPVLYNSTSVIFPLSPKSYDPRTKFSYMELYGSVEDANRVVTLAESGQIRDSIVKKYDLAKRYEYDTTDATEAHHLRLEYHGSLFVKETGKGAISITFYDKDADTAALIANDVVRLVDVINKAVIKDAVNKQFKTYKDIMQQKYGGLDSLSGILSYAKGEGKRSPNGEVTSMEMFHAFSRMKESEVNLEALSDDVHTVQIIERAKPNYKKAKPQRMILVLTSCISTFIITLLFLILKDRKDFEDEPVS